MKIDTVIASDTLNFEFFFLRLFYIALNYDYFQEASSLVVRSSSIILIAALSSEADQLGSV